MSVTAELLEINFKNFISGTRCVWIVSNSLVCGLHPIENVEGIFWCTVQSTSHHCIVNSRFHWHCIDHHRCVKKLKIVQRLLVLNQIVFFFIPFCDNRKSISMDWPFLLVARSVICKKSHSNHCFGIGTSTYVMVIILLWFAGNENLLFGCHLSDYGVVLHWCKKRLFLAPPFFYSKMMWKLPVVI